MDDKKQWIDYKIAENLIRVLERRNLLTPPKISPQSIPKGVELDDNT
jgi:hypothetical protein